MPTSNRLIVRVLTTSESPGLYKCNSCSKVIKSTNGFSNVMGHLKRFHPAYEDEAAAALRNPNLLALRLVDEHTTDIYRWLEWIVMEGLPLSFCERPLARHNSKMSRLSVETLKRYMDGVYEFVVERIKETLPSTFGIVLDGWISNSRHYVAIFAVFNDPDMPRPTATRSSDYHDDLECQT